MSAAEQSFILCITKSMWRVHNPEKHDKWALSKRQRHMTKLFKHLNTPHSGVIPNLPAWGQCINPSSFHPPPNPQALCAMWVSDEQMAKGVSIALFHHTHPLSKLTPAASRCSSPNQTSALQSASR